MYNCKVVRATSRSSLESQLNTFAREGYRVVGFQTLISSGSAGNLYAIMENATD